MFCEGSESLNFTFFLISGWSYSVYLRMQKILYCALLIGLLVSCSIKKRSYRNGYYVDWASGHKKKHSNDKNSTIVSHKPLKNESIEVEETVTQREEVTASYSNNLDFKTNSSQKQKNKTLIFGKNHQQTEECGDEINFRDGSVVKAKVVEVNEDNIKYRKCDNLEGPLFTVKKDNVESIKYKNGSTDVFVKKSKTFAGGSSAKSDGDKKKTHDLAIVALALAASSIVTGIFGAIAALIVAPIAKRKILSEPDKYDGLDLVKIAQIVSWIVIGLTVLVVAFILLLFFTLM